MKSNKWVLKGSGTEEGLCTLTRQVQTIYISDRLGNSYPYRSTHRQSCTNFRQETFYYIVIFFLCGETSSSSLIPLLYSLLYPSFCPFTTFVRLLLKLSQFSTAYCRWKENSSKYLLQSHITYKVTMLSYHNEDQYSKSDNGCFYLKTLFLSVGSLLKN